MMHILILNSEYPPLGGGAGNANAHIARILADMGHEIVVITSRFQNLPHQEKYNGLTIYRIPSLRQMQDRSGAFEQIIFMISASFSAVSLVRCFKPDATLAFFGVPSGVVAYLLKALYKIPYVVSLRGGDVPGFRPYDFRLFHKLLAPLLRIVWKHASAVVANSKGLRDLANTFDTRFKIPIIPNGVDLELYKSENRNETSPLLLSVGRVVYQKGFDLAMRALASIRDIEWIWHIAGDGPQMEALQALAKELGIAERVIFLGWQLRADLIEQYKKANLFIFPSRHEGMPNALLEAMASGLPVIATCIAGNEELVVNGETGFLVPSEDAKALGIAIRKLLTDTALRQHMGLASRRRVEENYSWENTAQQYANLLEKVK
jgi:glycosyltransferase involved in cell wall biosynthesis